MDKQQYYQEKREKINYLKTHDSLTGLMNLAGLKDATKRLNLHQYQMIMFDILNFKRVNEYLGFEYGNQILLDSSKWLLRYIGGRGIVIREHGNQFVIFLKQEDIQIASKSYVNDLFQDFYEYINQTTSLSLGVACGIVETKEDDLIDEIYVKTETVLRKQKEKNISGITIYNQEIANQYMREKELMMDLEEAFIREELVLFYQPQVDIYKKVIAYEALVRWEHPKHGLLYPNEILPLIRKRNYIKRLDYYVLEYSIKDLAKLEKFSQEIVIAVNVTAITLFDKNFVGFIKENLDKYKVNSKRLCIEVTEDYDILRKSEYSLVLKELKELGICVQVDDFGTGYSALNNIMKYNVDGIKIDKSLVDNITTDENDWVVVSGLITMFTQLDIEIVVEGVETKEQYDKLKIYDNLLFQGYYFGKPKAIECEEYKSVIV